MNIFIFNVLWMSWNAILAFIAVFLSWHILQSRSFLSKVVVCAVWLLFVPNTLYILTDAQHILWQWGYVEGALARLFLSLQFIVFIPLGITTFYLSMQLFEKSFRNIKPQFLIALNFLIGFGIVLGRTQRTNSWEVVTNPSGVLFDILQILVSGNLLFMTLITGIIANVVYFTMRRILEAPVSSRNIPARRTQKVRVAEERIQQ